MELIIDAGNTRIKAVQFQDGTIVNRFSCLSFYDPALQKFCNNPENTKAIVSSVREEKVPVYLFHENCRYIFFSHRLHFDFTIRYKTPETLGQDRLAAIAGAQRIFPGKNVLVIDAGTCITYDFINEKREYLGGSISPGLNMRFKALNSFTGKLPLLEPEEYSEINGLDTTGSIMSGVVKGIIFELNGFIEGWKEKYPDLQIILTGGDSAFLGKQLKSTIFAAPDLILTGLHQVLLKNA